MLIFQIFYYFKKIKIFTNQILLDKITLILIKFGEKFMKVLSYSHSNLFLNVSKIACSELDFSFVSTYQKETFCKLLKNQDIDLVLIDCDTFRPEKYNIQEYIQNISKNTYCLVVETTIHEIDKDDLLGQITRQCLLQEIYIFQQFVKLFYTHYWQESEKKISQQETNFQLFNENEYEDDDEIIDYDELFTVDENGIAIIKEKPAEYFENSIELGFGTKHQEEVKNKYIGLDPTTIKIFEYLKTNLNKPVSIKSLSTHTWGECNINKRNAIYVYIRKIRIYLGDNLDFPTKLIKCNKGFYTLKQL